MADYACSSRRSFWVLRCLGVVVGSLLSVSITVQAQGQLFGVLHGTIKDQQGGVLPSVTVTATPTDNRPPIVTLTDTSGFYTLKDLVPGDYEIKAELNGFATVAQPGVLARAGRTLSLDLVMQVGGLDEVVTVKRDSPLLETSSATTAVNVSGDLQRELPLAARKHWSEFLRLVPGAVSRDSSTDQASVFYIHGTGNASASTLVDGADMTSAINSWLGYTAFPDDTVSDVQIKTSGLDASAPLGMGAASNVILKSGTNSVRGSASLSYTPKRWIDNNTSGGTAQTMSLIQSDASMGGPLQKNRLWFFGSYRYRNGTLGVARTAAQIATLEELRPTFEPFDNDVSGHIVLGKLTGQFTASHNVSAFYNHDDTPYESSGPTNTAAFTRNVIGGSGASVTLASAWTSRLTSRLGFSWNDKGFRSEAHRADVPSIRVFADAFPSGGRLVGSTQLATLDNTTVSFDSPSRKWTITGDIAIQTTTRLGSHDIQVGVFVQPDVRRDNINSYVNDGFVVEDHVLNTPGQSPARTTAFRRQLYDVDREINLSTRYADYAAYVQDAWRPTQRVTVSIGLRLDRVARQDRLFDVNTQRSLEVGPRLGVNYMLTDDMRNGLRASYMRLHEAPNVNQSTIGTNAVGFRELYDLNLDGVFETSFVTPATSRLFPDRVVDPEYHQPYVDELAVGYRRQLSGHVTVDAGVIHREYRDRTALVEQNGIYENGVFQGYKNENLNEIYLLTNNVWNRPVYTAIEVIGTKQSEYLELTGSYTRAWNRMAGGWQPNDPASFIQPLAFPNNRGMESSDSRFVNLNSLNAPTGFPEWTNHVLRVSGIYRAPWNMSVAANYTLQQGRWSGPILTRLPAPDPVFGSSTIRLSNGRSVSNPLSTPIRFAFPTRGEGQFRLPGTHYLNLRIGRPFNVGRGSRVEVAADLFNVLNRGGYQGFLTGANQLDSPNYGAGGEIQTPRAAQLNVRFAF